MQTYIKVPPTPVCSPYLSHLSLNFRVLLSLFADEKLEVVTDGDLKFKFLTLGPALGWGSLLSPDAPAAPTLPPMALGDPFPSLGLRFAMSYEGSVRPSEGFLHSDTNLGP